MKEADVYRNAIGWRIEFELGGAIRVLTVRETVKLVAILRRALEHVPIYLLEDRGEKP